MQYHNDGYSRHGEIMSKHPNTEDHRLLALAILLAVAAANAALAQSAPVGGQLRMGGGPTMTFTQTTVSCSGLSPGDSIVLAGFVIDRTANTMALVTPTIAGQTDPNGIFTATVNGGVKPISVWLLLDMTTASYTVAEPEGSVLREMPDSMIEVSKGRALLGGPVPVASATIHRAHTHVFRFATGLPTMESRHLRTLTSAQPPADVRPDGVTVFEAKDGSASDGNGTIDGNVTLNFPDSLEVGDFLFVVDDHTLEFKVLLLDPCNLQQECSA